MATEQTPHGGIVQYATFLLDGLYFGIEVLKVQEVLRQQPTTPVPLAPPIVRGLINLRGQIVTAIDLRTRLGLPPRESGEPINVVIRSAEGAVSLLVDEIGDVLEVSPDQFERPPETLSGVIRELVSGVFKLSGRLLLVLDTKKAIEANHAPALAGETSA